MIELDDRFNEMKSVAPKASLLTPVNATFHNQPIHDDILDADSSQIIEQ